MTKTHTTSWPILHAWHLLGLLCLAGGGLAGCTPAADSPAVANTTQQHQNPVAVARGKIEVDGAPYLLETALGADFALVDAFLADYYGNLVYALTARNFNPVIAMAGKTVIADAAHIVPVGMISPDHVVTPAVLVDYLVAHA